MIICRFFTIFCWNIQIPPDPIKLSLFLDQYGLSKILSCFELSDYVKSTRSLFGFLINGDSVHTNLSEIIGKQKLFSEVLFDIEYFRISSKMEQKRFQSHIEWVSAVTGSSIGKSFFISGSYDGKLRFFTDSKSVCTFQVHAHNGPITSITIGENIATTHIVTAGKDSIAIVWKIDLDQKLCMPVRKMVDSNNAVKSCASSPSKQRFALSGWDSRIFVYLDIFSDIDGWKSFFTFSKKGGNRNDSWKGCRVITKRQNSYPFLLCDWFMLDFRKKTI